MTFRRALTGTRKGKSQYSPICPIKKKRKRNKKGVGAKGMEEPVWMRGAKRRIEPVRPDVAAAVGLCAHSNRDDNSVLSQRQRQRLDDIAVRLGVAPSPQGTCAALAAALGDEWTNASESADIFAAEEARAMGPLSVAPSRALLSGIAWSDLPPEMQVPIVRDLVERDPRAAAALYATGLAGARPFIGETHMAFIVDDQGALNQVNVPLIEYARLAAAFGETDPLDLFLASATCSLKALASWYASSDIRPNAEPAPNAQSIMRAPTGVSDAYVSALGEGLSNEAVDDIPLQQLTWAIERLPADPTIFDVARSILTGPLPGDAANVARQWYEFVTTPSTPVGRSYVPTDKIGVRSEVLRVRPSVVPQTLAVTAHERGIPLGVFPEPFNADAFRGMRLVGTVPSEQVRAWFLPYVTDQPRESKALDAWIAGPRFMRGAASTGLVDTLRNRTRQDPLPLVDAVDTIGEAIQDHVPTTGGCAAYLPSALVPDFAWLFTPSRGWLVRYKGRFWLFFQPRSTAIEQALAMAADRDSHA
ncbi:hypothetical protein pneo_cds_38 [Pandoravirus neocaledonia]|uniref:Uncharacterized protein n=1 Tax=Pandoravirus neocaledonia TaxID=2107708 RepID=A0A2U7UB99_9VIRU|nr:hypothetical protein pneo_cds_38 [Pandoravirus neocaledonia]AVK75645.1 hypothetical protein pneo_cds_38 [Pandoravirus neocaledonia]